MDEIIKSIDNGKRSNALKLLNESGFLLEDLFEKLLSIGKCEEIILMYRIAINKGYITFK